MHQGGIELVESVDVAGTRVALQGAEAGFAAQFRGQHRLVPEHRQQRAQLGGDALGAQHDSRPLLQHLAIGTGIGGHAGCSAGHRFQQGQRQALHKARQDEDLSALEQCNPGGQVWLVAPPEDPIVVELVHQAVAQWPVADDHQSAALR